MCLESYRVFGWGGQNLPRHPQFRQAIESTNLSSLRELHLRESFLKISLSSSGFSTQQPVTKVEVSGSTWLRHLLQLSIFLGWRRCTYRRCFWGTDEGNLIASTKNTSSTWIVKKSLRSFEDLWTQNQSTKKKIHQGHVMFLWANWYGYDSKFPTSTIDPRCARRWSPWCGRQCPAKKPSFQMWEKMGNRISSVW